MTAVDAPANVTDTCLYVTLRDSFGDGWQNGSMFYYWAEIQDRETNVVSDSVDCDCPMMAGCIHPSELNIDQLFHMTVVATDAEGVVYVPEYAWEVQWTVQVVEGGVWKEKYYGGYNSSFAFAYDRLSESYSLSSWSNLWVFPEFCNDCMESSRNGGQPFSYSDFLDDVVHEVGEPSVSSYGITNVSDYMATAWYITDASKMVLHAYSEPFCGEGDGSPGTLPGVGVDSLCGACLADGEYIFRSTGAGDPFGANVSWEFCGMSGDSQDEFHFWMDGGVCYPGEMGGACGSLSSRPTSVPSSEPSVSPSGEPTGVPSGRPSGEPSGTPSGEPSAHPPPPSENATGGAGASCPPPRARTSDGLGHHGTGAFALQVLSQRRMILSTQTCSRAWDSSRMMTSQSCCTRAPTSPRRTGVL